MKNEKTKLLHGSNANYGTNRDITTQIQLKPIVSSERKGVKALFQSIFNRIIIFSSVRFNNLKAEAMIKEYDLENLMFNVTHEYKASPDSSKLMDYVIKELPNHNLMLNSLTDMGFKLNESSFYRAMAVSLQKVLSDKLENVSNKAKSFD